ncbi:MAG: hypothetical protein RMJ17_01095 [Candidatus Aenigmarchaeota archaeon]|nr:hypothetical protein [Candidatus Aenigmarchaeota archaeon]MDW8149182.1 hypothetical protein [Candidatus Aenigmarchaeota archaeon]
MAKKAQAAMEFLMTYGIAILIVVGVIAALYAMGILRIGRGGPSCSPCFPAGTEFQYVDHNKDTLVLINGPYELTIQRVLKDGSQITCTGTGTTYQPNSRITLNCIGQLGGDVNIAIEYYRTEGVIKTAYATLHGA